MNHVVEQMNETTWRIEDGFVRFFLLEGSEKALLIDSGVTTADAKQIAESLTDKPVVLLNTHGDGDHVCGNGGFDSFYMHPADYQNCGVSTRFPQSILIPVTDGDIIDLGGRPLKLITIPGHTYGSIAILDCNNRVLYSGDTVQDGHIFMFGVHRSPEDFAASLQKLITYQADFDVIYASHETPVLPADYIETVAAAWQKVCQGDASYSVMDMHGNTVRCYEAEGCGFFCNLEM